jgi:hypothetical protein
MLTSPFQCDYCWFVNLTKRQARDIFDADARLLAYIRRVNLDIFWSKEPGTVGNTLRALEKGKKMSEEFGLPPVALTVGPWPVADTCGFQIAIEILRSSQLPGKNDTSYTQFDSIRKLRSAYLTVYESGPARCLDNGCIKTDKGQILSLINSATQSRLFTMFMQGCERRMGRLVKQDMGLSFDMLMCLLSKYDKELEEDNVTMERKRMILICAGTFVILFAGALRGGEVFMLEASEFVRRRDDGRNLDKNGHVVVPLMGRFKNETGERNLVIVLANETEGGLAIRKWVDRFTALLLAEGRGKITGPAICDSEGFVLERWKVNGELQSMLKRVQSENRNIIPADIDVEKKFSTYRSFRRGATTRAKEQGVSEATIITNNRWRAVQGKQGGLPNLPMSQLYVEITQALTTKLRFSKSL